MTNDAQGTRCLPVRRTRHPVDAVCPGSADTPMLPDRCRVHDIDDPTHDVPGRGKLGDGLLGDGLLDPGLLDPGLVDSAQ